MLRYVIALLISTASYGSDFPLAFSNFKGTFIEPLAGYESVSFSAEKFADCHVTNSESPPLVIHRCTPLDAKIKLVGPSGEHQVEFKNSLFQEGYYKGKEIHQMSLIGVVSGHPTIPNDEEIVFYFWYPVENVNNLRGHVLFKNLNLSKPFVLERK